MLPRLHGPLKLADYLPTEIESEFRREYVGGFWYGLHGESYAEDGTSVQHASILGNIYGVLLDQCDRRELWLGSSQFKLHIPEQGCFFYPDAAIYHPEQVQEWYGTNPFFLLEVTDERSAFIDRTLKYVSYTALPSLRTYLIVGQYERHVYAYQRDGEEWNLTEYDQTGEIPLPCLNVTLKLDEIYDGVLV